MRCIGEPNESRPRHPSKQRRRRVCTEFLPGFGVGREMTQKRLGSITRSSRNCFTTATATVGNGKLDRITAAAAEEKGDDNKKIQHDRERYEKT